MITLKDIAQRCGKTVSTVSRALRDDPRVTPKTRESIQAMAKEMGYRPNLAARRLVVGSSQTIWFVLSDLNYALSQTPAQAAGIALREAGYDLLVAPYHNDHDALFRIIGRLSQGVCDGTIIIPGPNSAAEQLQKLVKKGYPLVFLDRHLEGVSAPVVTTDNDAAAAELVDRCVDTGAKGIVSLFSTGNPVEKARRSGVCAAAKRHRIPVFDGVDGEADSVAIIASSQSVVLRCLRENSSKLSGRHLVAGTFDAWEGGSQPLEKVFVCIQDLHTMGQKAAEHLTRRLSGKTKRPAFRKITVPYKEIMVIEPL